ncbi:16S rRNA (cytidine(1402)-2'-O)-methyltransferase [Oceanobacillus sp. CAU 1775]
MKIQKSFENENAGAIHIVPTPIGNLEDITYRALNTLKTVELIAAEDTRNTKKLLNYFEISTPLTSYHEHNIKEKTGSLIAKAKDGAQIALVSDAGMPAISDPGYELVQEAIAEGVRVIVLPGANAALQALVGSGLPTDTFYFYGFLPRKKKDKENVLQQLKRLPTTIIFYESPFRVKDTLQAIQSELGNRQVAIARELTKRFEEYVRGTVEEVLDWATTNELRGEFVLVIEGASAEEASAEIAVEWWNDLTIIDHVNHYINEESLSNKEAIKKTAVDRKIPKRDVYQAYHIEE